MYRRYTVHKDGDLLVEDLDPSGKPLEPEPVPAEERLPYEVVLLAPDTAEGREKLLELLEAALEIETGDQTNWRLKPGGGGSGGGGKLPVV